MSISGWLKPEKDRDRAREHRRWLTAAMPEAHMRGKQWYPVKCDCVAKNTVMDLEKDDGKTHSVQRVKRNTLSSTGSTGSIRNIF
jgi:hypothetical protein